MGCPSCALNFEEAVRSLENLCSLDTVCIRKLDD